MRKTLFVIALLLSLPLAAADNHTLGARIIDGLQEMGALVTDVIVDLTTDVRIIIPSRTVITAEVPPPPVYDLTPKMPQAKIRAQELAEHNQKRKDEFKQKKPKKAPKDQDLPPFTMVLTPEIENIISRGTIFNAENMNMPSNVTTTIDGQPIPIDDASRLIHNEFAQQMRNGRGLDESQRLIVVHKRSAQNSPLTGEAYGNIVITTLSFRQVGSLEAGPRSPYLLVTTDTPLQAQIVDTDALIQGPLARSTTGTLGAVGVCIIDTGIDYTQQAFADNYVDGTDFVNNDADPLDDQGHGTRMAQAIITIAPGAQLYAAKALDNTGAGYASDAIQAIDWCMQQNVSVITMSFGGGTFPSWCDANLLAQKANEAVTRGFFVVAAAGNTGPALMQSPACASLVTSVGATDTTGNETIWNGSSLTEVTDILAPGVQLQLPDSTGNVAITGTSVSAAVLAGASAVVKENTALNPGPLQDLLRSTGVLFAANNVSYPRIDLYNALTNQTNGLDLAQSGTQSNDTVGRVYTSDACTQNTDPCYEFGDGVQCYMCDDCNSGTQGTCSSGVCSSTSGLTCSQENGACCASEDAKFGACLDNPPAGCTIDACYMGGDQDGDTLSDACDTDCPANTQSRGGACTCDYECSVEDANDVCKNSVYQGSVTGSRCLPNSYCVDGGGTVRASGYNAGSDTCFGHSSGGSVWLANTGRWQVQNTGATVLAVIDKYGSMGVRGSRTTSSGSFDSGWQLKNSGGTTVASINSANGNLNTASTISARDGSISCTGFKVQNTGAVVKACWSTAGALELAGDFAYSLSLT